MPVDRHVLANERTLMAWLRLAATMGLGAFLVNVLQKSSSKAALGPMSLVQSLVAIIIAAVSLVRFYQRDYLLKSRHMGAAFGDWMLPVLSGGMILAIVVSATGSAISRWAEWHFHGPECVALPGFLETPGAPRPHVYVSFHGSSEPTSAICHPEQGVSGIHKFSLASGEYVGPATDQLSAVQKMPRQLLVAGDHLLVADGAPSMSSVAVFGRCVPPEPDHVSVPPREFLGVIRAPAQDTRSAEGLLAHGAPVTPLAMEHPYGLALGPDGSTLHVSTQNGGAAISVSLKNGSMALTQQVAPPVPLVGRQVGGPLRGIAVDAANCMHVADRKAHRVAHYCPADAPQPSGFTEVKHPIALSVVHDMPHEAGTLLVGSVEKRASLDADGSDIGDAEGVVLAFPLDLHKPVFPLQVSATYGDKKSLSHPAGMLVSGGLLYVLDQSSKQLLSFDLETAKYKGAAIKTLPDVPEDVALVPDGC
ncbi:hypothetical protein EMIHUDRAFT_468687 [Emiliania huxleyi CCMP1516]|uniref:DUF202 domain-containing protein n=2 Tax=Emiliania huxleyi TaxID=2903 RepID=A0A0D3JYP6_EMIH1|nr:hypothetical protein EMIHUDRAFT_468687 [Emiliania huxleyi CCMP1516]EOD28631.1 hypothetical protein EMIHUDRAFT_468687 [Emiliania huxleyi CCMP1516]|eukprot:XP_005781060.1 hypothetical protein EMIHUDRAFT_468687 [Emiliania huxleyi CCMP1516]